MRNPHIVNQATRAASRASRGRPMEHLSRAGFAAKGLVYLVVGVLALLAAFTSRGEVTDTKGAVRTIGELPGGNVLLAVLAIGLFGYAAWRFVEAAANTENANGIKRAGAVISGFVYGSLALYALRSAMDARTSGGASAEDWTATLMAQPFGPILVGLVAFAIIGYGGYQVHKGIQEGFREHLSGMTSQQEESAVRMGKAGHIARGVVFGIIGLFLLVAATKANPNEAIGLDGALSTLARQPYGPWLLGLVAIGLACYGIYFLAFESRFHRLRH